MKDFYRVVSASPTCIVADVKVNAQAILAAFKQGVDAGAHVIVTPELSLTGATCGDLFGNAALLRHTEAALEEIMNGMVGVSLESVLIVGLPVIVGTRLFNCAAVLHGGAILGLVPKQNLRNYGAYNEARTFSPASEARLNTVCFCGYEVPFGNDLVFDSEFSFRFGIELGADIELLVPPSVKLVQAGAQLILCPYVDGEVIGRSAYRRRYALAQSERLACCYAIAGAGVGESSTSGVMIGQCLIAERGRLLSDLSQADASPEGVFAYGDFNPIWIETVRRRESAFNALPFADEIRVVDVPEMYHDVDAEHADLTSHPFVPSDPIELATVCKEVLQIQIEALARRVRHTQSQRLVLGLSGGLDSTLALLVCLGVCERLGFANDRILAITMPGFGTGCRTRDNVDKLAKAFGFELRCIPITDAITEHFASIGHDPKDLSIVYENSQARERTQILMDISNGCNGLMIGTGDLSETALGFCTFGGDHLAMYGVNSGVPKTLMRAVITDWATRTTPLARESLLDIVATPVSPELLPNEQHTESIVGEYILHDFYLYYFVKYTLGQEELLELGLALLKDLYSAELIEKTLNIFMRRFTTQQFKRNAMADAPQVSEISLAAHGGWQMPSDIATSWYQP